MLYSECYCFLFSYFLPLFNNATVITLKTTNLEQLAELFPYVSKKKIVRTNCSVVKKSMHRKWVC